VLFAGSVVNWLLNPTQRVLDQFEATEYYARP